MATNTQSDAERIAELEAEGLTHSDAYAAMEAEKRAPEFPDLTYYHGCAYAGDPEQGAPRILLADRSEPQTRPYERDDWMKEVIRRHNAYPGLVAALGTERAAPNCLNRDLVIADIAVQAGAMLEAETIRPPEGGSLLIREACVRLADAFIEHHRQTDWESGHVDYVEAIDDWAASHLRTSFPAATADAVMARYNLSSEDWDATPSALRRALIEEEQKRG
jgi:hypothetical protein